MVSFGVEKALNGLSLAQTASPPHVTEEFGEREGSVSRLSHIGQPFFGGVPAGTAWYTHRAFEAPEEVVPASKQVAL